MPNYKLGKKSTRGWAILKSSTGGKWKVFAHSSTRKKGTAGIKASQRGRKPKWD